MRFERAAGDPSVRESARSHAGAPPAGAGGRGGFGLAEVVVVLVILSALLVMAVPGYLSMKERAQEAGVKSNVHVVQVAVEVWCADHDGEVPALAEIGAWMFPGSAFPANPFTGAPSSIGPLAAFSRGDVGYGAAGPIYVIEGYGGEPDTGPGENGVVITVSNGRAPRGRR